MESRTPSPNVPKQLLVAKKRELIQEKESQRDTSARAYDAFVKIAARDQDDESLNEFIQRKAALVTSELEYHEALLSTLDDSDPSTKDERDAIFKQLNYLFHEQQALQRSKRGLSEDLESTMAASKRQRILNGGDRPTIEEMEHAYTQLVLTTLKIAGGNPPTKDFKQHKFKARVLEYYNGTERFGKSKPFHYCHLTGSWGDSDKVVAAHIVPKSFAPESTEYLFGSDEELARASPRNALLLYHTIEKALDKGDIVIVPIPTPVGSPTRWKCVLLNLELRAEKYMVYQRTGSGGPEFMRWTELEGKELEFRNDNRPAKRFLYFRFVGNLLMARENGQRNVLEMLLEGQDGDDKLKSFWPSPGEYVRKSTLTTLARQVSGLELPSRLVDETTFEDGEDRNTMKTLRLALDMRGNVDNKSFM